MRNRIRNTPYAAGRFTKSKLAALVLTAMVPSFSQAAVLYKTGFGDADGNNNASFTVAITTYTATGGSAAGVAAGGRGVGRGDDYSTAFASLTITSLRFVGNLQANADGFAVEFYNADGTRNSAATIYPTENASTFRSSTAHVVTPNTPVTVSGSGYIVFAPYTYNYDTGASPQISLGYSDGFNAATFDVGTNNAATSVEANYGPDYPSSTDRSLSFIDIDKVPDRLSLELNGTGVPEPTTVALIAPVVLLLKRRRRA